MPASSPLKGLTPSALRHRHAAIVAAAERAPDAAAMLKAASVAVSRYVPSDAEGWSVADPAIVLPTWPLYLDNIVMSRSNAYWEREFLVEDRLLFRDLAAREVPVGRLRHETAGLLARSPRYRESLAALGFADELRAVLRVSGTVWGLVDLARGADKEPFSDAEASFIAGLVEPLAAVLRDKVMGAESGIVTVGSPGLLLFDAAGALVSFNGSANEWLKEMPNQVDQSGLLPSPVRAVLAYARAVELGQQRGPARVRVRVRSGQWAMVDASGVRAADGTARGTAVMIAPATSAEMASIFVSAYDLSAREQAVIALLARGTATASIASELRLSVFTVRDHIKSIFAKVRVSSRGELVAKLFTEQFQQGTAAQPAVTG